MITRNPDTSTDVDAVLARVEGKARAAARSRAEVDALIQRITDTEAHERPKVYSTELMVRPHTAVDTASV